MNVIYCKYNINDILTFISKKNPDMDTKERTIRWGRAFKKELVKSTGKASSQIGGLWSAPSRGADQKPFTWEVAGKGVRCWMLYQPKNSGIKCIFLFFSVNVFFSQMIGNGVGKTSLKSNLEYLLVQIRPNYFNIRLSSFLLKKFIFYLSPNADMLPGGKWVGLEFAVYVSFVLHLIL